MVCLFFSEKLFSFQIEKIFTPSKNIFKDYFTFENYFILFERFAVFIRIWGRQLDFRLLLSKMPKYQGGAAACRKANALTRWTLINIIVAAGVSRLKLPPAGIFVFICGQAWCLHVLVVKARSISAFQFFAFRFFPSRVPFSSTVCPIIAESNL